MEKDVVCGIEVDPDEATASGLTSEYEGQTYYFYERGCKRRFDLNLQRYVSRATPTADR